MSRVFLSSGSCMARVADSRTKQNYVAMLRTVANIHTQWRYTFTPTCLTKDQDKVTIIIQ